MCHPKVECISVVPPSILSQKITLGENKQQMSKPVTVYSKPAEHTEQSIKNSQN